MGRLLRSRDVAGALAELRNRPVNYAEADAPNAAEHRGWHVDTTRAVLGQEPPGSPVKGGAWEIACRLVRAYEFADPDVIRAVYRPSDELLGRDMLLEGRFGLLRFVMGVRITSVLDEIRDCERVWGWGYQTLEGHLEQGKLTYLVVKHMPSGNVELRIEAYSRRAPIPNPIVRLGFRVFGRRIQLRFYREVGRRLRDSTQAALQGAPLPEPTTTAAGLVIAPSGMRSHPLERITNHVHHPGR